MHLLGGRALGIIMLVLLSLLVLVKRLATGSVIEYKSRENLWAWLTNNFNLFFLMVVNPVAATLLIGTDLEPVDRHQMAIDGLQLVIGLEITGLVFYALGFLLMAWALLSLAGNYQLGGSTPRGEDQIVTAGPYRYIRHPMYTAALSISLGLACLIQSVVLLSIFCVYAVLILILIPIEEAGLQQAYLDRYLAYQKKVKKLIPYLY